MQNIIEKFLEYLKTEKRRADNTLYSYKLDLSAFVAFLNTKNVKDFNAATLENLQEYCEKLRNSDKSKSTVARQIASLKTFYKFLLENGYIVTNYARQLNGQMVERNVNRELLTSDEIKRFLACVQGNGTKEIRDKAMVEMLVQTGLNASAITSLDVKDYNGESIVVRQPRGDKVYGLVQQVRRLVDDYLENSRPRLVMRDGVKALFVNYNGTKMTRQGLWKIIKNYQEIAGIKKEITPRMLKNSVAELRK
ncbi:MAG: site-specific integrase [Clostridiales bacterium]|nr:site-specific integrase [Clostridiales bacterium]